jgi:choline monooxygenase
MRAGSDLQMTMPASCYSDPAVFARERSQIFARNWSLFTWSEHLLQSGSYVTGTCAGYPVVVIRGEDGVARGFHNVCRHRAAALFANETGTCGKHIVCPYHSWCYDLTGRLERATDFGAKLDPETWGLHAIDVEEWRGLVFVRVRRDGPTLREWLGPIDTMAADYPLEAQHYFSSRIREEDVDWKIYGENYLECYHCRVMHPGLCAAMDIKQYKIDVYADEWLFHLYAPRRDGGLTRGLYFYRFPYLMMALYDWGSSLATIEPLGPGRIRHINWYFFTDISPERAAENTRVADWSAEIVTEDFNVVCGVQRNLSAGIYEQGPLSPRYEHAVLAFQQMVRNSLDNPPLRAAAE